MVMVGRVYSCDNSFRGIAKYTRCRGANFGVDLEEEVVVALDSMCRVG